SGNPFGAAKRLERKARFAAFYAANAPKFRIIKEILNRLLPQFPAATSPALRWGTFTEMCGKEITSSAIASQLRCNQEFCGQV
ncbi:MAG: hypothetical protein LBQ57_00565, partial [Spirochaetales bacterium]|nr:hypothetical protein [Spirochaetales bacterium]